MHGRINSGIKSHQHPCTNNKLEKAWICTGGAWRDPEDPEGKKPFVSLRGCIQYLYPFAFEFESQGTTQVKFGIFL